MDGEEREEDVGEILRRIDERTERIMAQLDDLLAQLNTDSAEAQALQALLATANQQVTDLQAALAAAQAAGAGPDLQPAIDLANAIGVTLTPAAPPAPAP